MALRYGLSALSRISTEAAAALTEQIFFAPPSTRLLLPDSSNQ